MWNQNLECCSDQKPPPSVPYLEATEGFSGWAPVVAQASQDLSLFAASIQSVIILTANPIWPLVLLATRISAIYLSSDCFLSSPTHSSALSIQYSEYTPSSLSETTPTAIPPQTRPRQIGAITLIALLAILAFTSNVSAVIHPCPDLCVVESTTISGHATTTTSCVPCPTS